MKYILYFEPVDIEAENTEEAIRIFEYARIQPDVLKILANPHGFDSKEILKSTAQLDAIIKGCRKCMIVLPVGSEMEAFWNYCPVCGGPMELDPDGKIFEIKPEDFETKADSKDGFYDV